MARDKDKKKNKKGMSTKEKDAMSRALIIAIIIFVIAIVLVFIPENVINEIGKTKAQQQYEDNLQGKVGANEDIQVIDVVEDKAKYNTIYNGENYDEAVAAYWAKYPNVDNASIYKYLNSVDLNGIYEPLVHGEVDTTLTVTLSETDTFNKQMLTDFEKIYFDKTLECIGVVRDYFAIMRYPETNSIFVLDCRDKYFSHSESLLQIGLRVSGSLDTQYVTCKQDNGFDYYFVGVVNADLGKESLEVSVEEAWSAVDLTQAISVDKSIKLSDCPTISDKVLYASYEVQSVEAVRNLLATVSNDEAVYIMNAELVESSSDCFLFRLSDTLFMCLVDSTAEYHKGNSYSVPVPIGNITVASESGFSIMYVRNK